MYTQESNYLSMMNGNIHHFWETREEGQYRTPDKKSLYWCRFINKSNSKVLMIVNGRIECSIKYQELCYDLFQQGYNIYIYDHRGQGWSDRLTSSPQNIGHVEEFQDYVNDLAEIVSYFDLSHYAYRYLLGHSMGCTIAMRYLQTHPHHPFHAMALSAPMLGFKMPWYLKPISILYAQLLTVYHRKPTYAPSCQPYQDLPFEGNRLTHSQVRYQRFRSLYQSNPELQVGGPSIRWVWQSLIAMKQCHQLTRQIKIPTLIIQAGQDEVVHGASQKRFFNKLSRHQADARWLSIEHGKHELLFESDLIRNLALDSILKFYQSFPK